MRIFKALLCAVALTAFAPAFASAKVYEIGNTSPVAIPSCPSHCFAVTRETGYQLQVGTTRSVDVVPRDGSIVAWTLSLGKTGKKQTAFFATSYGATPQARITILHTVSKLKYRVVGQSPLMVLTPYLGQTVQFPLAASIKVKKGDIVALSVPTWAPVLAVDLPASTLWRSSEPLGSCSPQPTTPQAALQVPAIAKFLCLNKARLTYSATLVSAPGTPVITTPKPPTPSTTTTTTKPTTTSTTPTTTTGSTTPKKTGR